MRIKTVLLTGLWVALAAPVAAMDAKVYAYPTYENYCPAGLRPVTIDGVICCGVPNQSVSYHSMMAHPTVRKRHKTHTPYRHDCPAGVKGCR